MTAPAIYTLDAGNSSEKLVLWEKNSPKSFVEKGHPSKNDIVIYSSVVDRPTLPQTLKTKEVKQLSFKNFGKMPSEYGKKAGIDRLLFAYYAYHSFIEGKSSRILLVDAGTFCTMDLIDSTRGFLGGIILPGIKLINSCYTQGNQLPLVQGPADNTLHYPFKSTEETLASSSIFSLASNIFHICSLSKPNKVLLTGGNASQLATQLNELNIPLEIDEFAVHRGLYLYYQEELGQETRDMK